MSVASAEANSNDEYNHMAVAALLAASSDLILSAQRYTLLLMFYALIIKICGQ